MGGVRRQRQGDRRRVTQSHDAAGVREGHRSAEAEEEAARVQAEEEGAFEQVSWPLQTLACLSSLAHPVLVPGADELRARVRRASTSMSANRPATISDRDFFEPAELASLRLCVRGFPSSQCTSRARTGITVLVAVLSHATFRLLFYAQLD